MTTQTNLRSQFEYISKFKLLISKARPETQGSFTDYTLFFFSFLREAELHPVENIIISSPAMPEEFSRKLHNWFNDYILPQLRHLGVNRIAIVCGSPQCKNPGSPVFYGKNPETGLFPSMPEAKAWIAGLFNKSGKTGDPGDTRLFTAYKITG